MAHTHTHHHTATPYRFLRIKRSVKTHTLEYNSLSRNHSKMWSLSRNHSKMWSLSRNHSKMWSLSRNHSKMWSLSRNHSKMWSLSRNHSKMWSLSRNHSKMWIYLCFVVVDITSLYVTCFAFLIFNQFRIHLTRKSINTRQT